MVNKLVLDIGLFHQCCASAGVEPVTNPNPKPYEPVYGKLECIDPINYLFHGVSTMKCITDEKINFCV